METSRWDNGDDDDSFWYKVLDQVPELLMTTLKVSGSVSLQEVIVKGCHCNLEILGTLMKMVLVGA